MEKKVTLLVIALLITLSGISKTKLFAIYNPEFYIGMQDRDAYAFQKFIFEINSDTSKKFYFCSNETELLRIMEAADGVMFFNTYNWDSIFSDGFYYRFERFVKKGSKSIFLASSYPTGRWADFFGIRRTSSTEYATSGIRMVNENANKIMHDSDVTEPFPVEEFMPVMDIGSEQSPVLVSDKEMPLSTCSDADSLRIFWSTFGYDHSHYHRWEVSSHLYGGVSWVFYDDKEDNSCKLHIDSLDTTQNAIILKKTRGDFVEFSRGYESIYDSSQRHFRFIQEILPSTTEYQLILELKNGNDVESNVITIEQK